MKIGKRILSTFLVVLMCLTAAPLDGFVDLELPELNIDSWFESIGDVFSSKASAKKESNYTYFVSNDEATITDVDYATMTSIIAGNVIIPSTLGGYPVTTIGEKAFCDMNRIKSITIPYGVTKIGNYAFANCGNLLSIIIPNSVKSIGDYAFSECDELLSITIPNSVTTIGEEVFAACDSLVSVYYNGTKDQWSEISISPCNFYLMKVATIYYDYKHDSDTEVVNPQFPAGYDFKEDSFNFINNLSANISKKYYTTLFESGTASLVYEETHKAGGLCYGFVYANAAIYNGFPSIANIYDIGNAMVYDNIRQVNRDSQVRIGGKQISVYDFIKYSYIYQYSQEALNLLYSTANDSFGLLNTVKSFTNDNRMGVAVGFSKRNDAPESAPGGHEVLAIGYSGNKILIDNPNNSSSYEILTVNSDGSWTFGNYNSEHHVLDYAVNIHRPYQLLSTGTKVTPWDSIVNKNDVASKDETYIDGIDKLDAEYTLVSISSDEFTINSNDYVEFPSNYKSGENSDNSNNKLFWIKDVNTITVSNLMDEINTIKYAGDDTVISTVVDKNSSVTITIDDGKNIAEINTDEGSESTVSIDTVDDDGNEKIITIDGIASTDEVIASETEDGIQVTGLNDITVTYETADGTAETKADVKDGSTVNIITNDDENKVETDWQDKQPDSDETESPCKHPDTDHNGICDNCGKDFTADCGHSCHSNNAFVQFFYKIARFFWKLFGMQNKRFCGCGKAHW